MFSFVGQKTVVEADSAFIPVAAVNLLYMRAFAFQPRLGEAKTVTSIALQHVPIKDFIRTATALGIVQEMNYRLMQILPLVR